MPTTERIKIVGVQFAVNPDHERGTEMTAEEQQHTIDFLTMLDRKRPRVSVKPEPTNEYDKDAFVVRFLSKKVGYVRDSDDYKAKAHAALEEMARFKRKFTKSISAERSLWKYGAKKEPTAIKDMWARQRTLSIDYAKLSRLHPVANGLKKALEELKTEIQKTQSAKR